MDGSERDGALSKARGPSGSLVDRTRTENPKDESQEYLDIRLMVALDLG